MPRKSQETSVVSVNANGEDLTVLKQSNQLVRAKYRSTLFSNKLSDLCLARVHEDEKGRLCAKITAQEIREFTGFKGNSLYNTLKNVSVKSLNRYVVISDGRNFKMFNVTNTCSYVDGVFEVIFNDNMRPYIMDIKRNYTLYDITFLSRFKSNSCRRLFMILATSAYRLSQYSSVCVTYSLGELRAELGCIDASEEAVQQAIRNGVDWNTIAEEVAKDKIYPSWSSFKNSILEPSRKSLLTMEGSEFIFDYEPIHSGSCHKVTQVKFTLRRNPIYTGNKFSSNPVIVESGNGFIDMIPEVRGIMESINLSDNDILSIIEEADGNLEKISNAYSISQKQSGVIKNFVGFMRSAIKGEWSEEEHVPAMNGSTENAEAFLEVEEQIRKTRERMQEIMEEYECGILDIDSITENEKRMLLKTLEMRRRKRS